MHQVTVETYSDPSVARQYARQCAPFWAEFPRHILEGFKSKAEPGRLVLNAGSGPGNDSEALRDIGLDVVCLDASPAMVGQTRAKGFESYQQDLMNPEGFKPKMFDGVWAFTSLIHIPREDLFQAVFGLRQLLRDGGAFGLGMIETRGRQRITENLSRTYAGERYIAYYTEEELRSLLKRAGFRLFDMNRLRANHTNYIFLNSEKLR